VIAPKVSAHTPECAKAGRAGDEADRARVEAYRAWLKADSDVDAAYRARDEAHKSCGGAL
jgi:hypothetical protein